ncbi:hypothetical protein NM688_g961 [Phlebia brevispora]|uniref:Uncharacterized protein n=1 Tax=Phlebia brevispora TaxID=194682 RepID=A0ACC1TCM6_9APHY|nr:hypothetical protein NM688_g961 [Phlebia brevispora]
MSAVTKGPFHHAAGQKRAITAVAINAWHHEQVELKAARDDLENDNWRTFVTTTEKRALLNGAKLEMDVDRSGAASKAWLEFAKGNDGRY